MSIKKPRGLRNNNPLNIRRTKDKWVGEKPQKYDRDFVEFISLFYGFRAAAIILMRYYYVYNLKSIDEIISRWAPCAENDTSSYIVFVRSRMSYLYPEISELPSPHLNPQYWKDLLFSMASFENGVDPSIFSHLSEKVILAIKTAGDNE